MNTRTAPQDLAPFGEDHGPLLTGVYAPVMDELELRDLKPVKGVIPNNLNGVYLRAGPNARYAPNGRYHPFDGDGMVHGAHFDNGHLTYRNRWVHTDGWMDLPGPRLPHDMAVTEHYSVLHDLPLFHDHEAMALGRHKIEFHPEMHSRFGVLPRFGASDSIRWFDFTPCYLYHVVNAWEEGDWVVMVGCRYMPALDAQGDIDAQRTARDVAELVMHARLWVWKMQVKTGETAEHVLNAKYNAEFPSCNGRLTGRKTRFGYLVDHSETVTLQWSGVRKFDLDTGADLGGWSDDPQHSWYSEPWFAEADAPQAEDHGYVISFQWNDARKRQTLDVFDARNIGQGPVAQVELPQRLPAGFHACWIKKDRLQPVR